MFACPLSLYPKEAKALNGQIMNCINEEYEKYLVNDKHGNRKCKRGGGRWGVALLPTWPLLWIPDLWDPSEVHPGEGRNQVGCNTSVVLGGDCFTLVLFSRRLQTPRCQASVCPCSSSSSLAIFPPLLLFPPLDGPSLLSPFALILSIPWKLPVFPTSCQILLLVFPPVSPPSWLLLRASGLP